MKDFIKRGESEKVSEKNREEFLEEGGKIFSGWPEYIALPMTVK